MFTERKPIMIADGNFFLRFFRWNILDIGIVILSIVGITLEEVESKIIPINPTIIRVMRVMRIARGMYSNIVQYPFPPPVLRSNLPCGAAGGNCKRSWTFIKIDFRTDSWNFGFCFRALLTYPQRTHGLSSAQKNIAFVGPSRSSYTCLSASDSIFCWCSVKRK